MRHLEDSENLELRRVFQESQQEAKRVIRQEKRAFLNDKIQRMEQDSNNQTRSKSFYKEVRNVKRGFQPKSIGVKDNAGNLLVNEKAVSLRWTEHFEVLLNREPPGEAARIQQAQDTEGEEEPPTRAEVKEAISSLKNDKAPGMDMLSAELFKVPEESLLDEVAELVRMIWVQEIVPDGCNAAVIIALYKKGDKEICGNYRGLSLLKVMYKILARIIYRRLIT